MANNTFEDDRDEAASTLELALEEGVVILCGGVLHITLPRASDQS
jgi:hypothetical protein